MARTSGDGAGRSARLVADAPSGAGQAVPAEFIGRAGELRLYAAGDLEALAETWRKFQTRAWHTPFQDIDWAQAWLNAAGRDNGHRPFIVLGYQRDELQLVLPLAIVRARGLNQLRWLAQNANDYNAPLITPAFAARCDRAMTDDIWRVVLDACGPVDLMDFSQQPDRIAGQANNFIAQNAIAASCSSHLVNLRPGWSEFYAQLRGSKSRKRLREKENKLAKLGKLQFRCEKEPDARRRLIRQAIAWKSQQLDVNGDRNPFAPDTADADAGSAIERTLLALCNAPEARHKLRVDGFFLDGEPKAVIIALVAGARYSVFITAHTVDHTLKFSPGTTLLVKTMQLACRAGYAQYDFLAGDETYKMTWCDEHVGLWDQVRGLTLKGKSAAPIVRTVRQVKKAAKQNSRVLELLKNLNRRRLMSS